MKINIATRCNNAGWRKYLLIDTDKREYSRESTHWFCREDFMEVTSADFKRILEKVENNYKEIQYMTPY